jgi:hypothetical protein
MKSDKLNTELAALISKHGLESIKSAISTFGSDGHTLSIISDAGIHREPTELILGEKYYFSEGMIDTSTDETVSDHLLACSTKLAQKLKEREWSEVRLFFSGHNLLSSYAKVTVYRVAHLNTVDYGFFGEAGYRKVHLNLRKKILDGL